MKFLELLAGKPLPKTKHYDIGKVYTLRVDELQRRPEQLNSPIDEQIITLMTQRIKEKNIFQKVAFIQDANALIVIAGEHWFEAAKRLGIKHIRACCVDSYLYDGRDIFIDEG